MDIEPFYAEQLFRDPINFPYGFARSGEFTIEQSHLLEQHGDAFQQLHAGTREPVNEQECSFVAVCRGEKDAETLHERTWKRYRENLQKSGMIYSLARGTSNADSWEPGSDEAL